MNTQGEWRGSMLALGLKQRNRTGKFRE